MDAGNIVAILQELLYLIVVFVAGLSYGLVRGRQALINLILALYFALLISLKFPYYDALFGAINSDRVSNSFIMILVFGAFTAGAIFLFERLMPRDPAESAFEGFGKKALLALLASVLVMAYSYHVLPITELITPGSPIQMLFAPESRFFWWLLIPAFGLLFL